MSHHASTATCAAPEPTPNRLAGEKSPYLLQHAGNPVDWYPWGNQAFTQAEQLDRPIFLSIGYATCHWCHVMERESFEDQAVARLMNQAFINIKVDREERPDVDQVYMTACQAMTGSGGWPLTIIMTPDGLPFFAATYLPKQSGYGRIGMLDLIPRVRTLWAERRGELLGSARQIVAHLRDMSWQRSGSVNTTNLVRRTVQALANQFDAEHGGFAIAPKFPSPHTLLFLLGEWAHSGDRNALEMVERTLTAMRRGGIYDHIGFGFHRYSTDREWLVPHFEKMLYDQAMLVLAYTEAYRATGKPEYRQTVEEVLAYVARDMTAPDGGFYSAEDADSEGEEGRFYLWSVEQVREVLGPDDARLAAALWSLTEEGNYHDEAGGRTTGRNIPHHNDPPEQVARRFDLGVEELQARSEALRGRLLAVRERRTRPLLDDKVLTDWNGLMAAALARAGRVLDEPRYVDTAARAIDLVLERMRDGKGRLLHRFRDGEAAIPGFLDDYAAVTWALLELYEASLEPARLEQALQLQQETIRLFWDDDKGGFFFTADDAEELLLRQKEVYDGAIPSGNSIALWNLSRLARLTGDRDLSEQARQLVTAFSTELTTMPSAHCHLVNALQSNAGGSVEVVVVGKPGAEDTNALLQVIHTTAPPHTTLLLVPADDSGDCIRRLAPFTTDHEMIDGRATAYLCRDFECRLPTADPAELEQMLRDASVLRLKFGV